jgi:HEAT repeat protein
MTAKDVARLWEELRYRDPEEKMGWIRQFAQNPTEESVGVLLEALEQESWFLRDQAARVLATLGEPVAGALIEHLSHGLWYTRASAASALGRMGFPVAAGPLTQLLKDPNRTVRDAAWDALVALAANELAARELAQVFQTLPERARRYALDGLLSRDPDAAGRILQHMGEEIPTGATDPLTGEPVVDAERADLSWDDVVGGGEARRAVR